MRMTWITIFILALLGCGNSDKSRYSNPPIAGAPHLHEGHPAAFNLAWGSWKDSSTVEYAFGRLPKAVDETKVKALFAQAFHVWEGPMAKTAVLVEDPTKADIVIYFSEIDGLGGTLGHSEFPPIETRGQTPIEVILDLWDFNIYQEELVDPLTVNIHELGHAIGLYHSEHPESVMWSAYMGVRHKLYIDDEAAARTKYNNMAPFVYDSHNYVWIKNTDDQINKYFKEKEFFSKCKGFEYATHPLDKGLIEALYFIRRRYKCPIKVTSSFRDAYCNAAANGASRSQHLKWRALDWKFVGSKARAAQRRYTENITDKDCEYDQLLDYGIRGLGIYSNGVNHIDTRDGKVATWGLLNQMGTDPEASENVHYEEDKTEHD